MQGDITHTKNLTIEKVSRIHFRGGSYISVARENPTKDPRLLENTVASLLRLNVDVAAESYLIARRCMLRMSKYDFDDPLPEEI
jgi:hypothetical protein